MTVGIAMQQGATSGHPLATRAGTDVLATGGSSVDAVLAMAFVQWVVSAPTCGPGGDLFVMHAEYVQGELRTTVYGGWSRTPLRVNPDTDLVYSGPTGAVVPGALAGAEAAWQSKGRLPWRQLFEHAESLCAGHVVFPWMARCYAEVERRGHGAAMAAFFDESSLFAEGNSVSSSRFATTLRRIAEHGASDFFTGGLARSIVKASRDAGGRIEADDLAAQKASITNAMSVDLGDIQLKFPGYPSQASILGEILNAAPMNVCAEDRAFAEIVAPLTKQALIDRCVVGIPGTAVAVATDGNSAAVVVHSLAGVQFGTGWIAGDTGIALGNRLGTALSNRIDLPAANPKPGEALPHTLSAALFASDQRWMLIATPGGDRQVQWLAQAGQRFRQGASVNEIVSEPRWFVCPEGNRFGVPGGIDNEWFMFAEPGIHWYDESNTAGFRVRKMDNIGGGLQAICREQNEWTIASDPRSGGIVSFVEVR